ncbi:hypothetical protein HDU88_008144 [Geranomyces variabilis]|nr:hypothetical protein HDU88_008144 [Geranomyces variabilis]
MSPFLQGDIRAMIHETRSIAQPPKGDLRPTVDSDENLMTVMNSRGMRRILLTAGDSHDAKRRRLDEISPVVIKADPFEDIVRNPLLTPQVSPVDARPPNDVPALHPDRAAAMARDDRETWRHAVRVAVIIPESIIKTVNARKDIMTTRRTEMSVENAKVPIKPC